MLVKICYRVGLPVSIMKRCVGIYLRVTTDGQATENQRRELEAVAARSGWEAVGIYQDAGISGSNGREKRPGLDRLLKDTTARRINMIAAWSVDRLGRSLQHREPHSYFRWQISDTARVERGYARKPRHQGSSNPKHRSPSRFSRRPGAGRIGSLLQ